MRLESKDIVLVPHTLDYVTDDYVSWLNNPEIVRYSEQRFKKHTLESCREYVKSFEGTPSQLWAIIEKVNSHHIGNICAIIDKQNNIAELRILIGSKSFHGKGYGSQAWLLVMSDCFAKGIRKIFAGTLSTNQPMISSMKKCGMKIEAEIPRQNLWEGQEVGIVLMAKYKEAN